MDARQMGGKRAAIGAALVGAGATPTGSLVSSAASVAAMACSISSSARAAAPDRASPNAAKVRAATGAANAAGDRFATAPGRAPRSRHRAPRAPPQAALAARRYPLELRCALAHEVRNQIRAPLWHASLIQLVTASHDAAVGRGTSCACRRDQSNPSTRAASCDAVSRITPSLIGGQRNVPCSSRFQNSASPDPSQARIFRRSARFDRKMKIVPENGSCRSCSRTSAARLSAPRRVHRLGRHQHPHAGRNRNHVAAFTAQHRHQRRGINPERNRTVAAPITISIIAAPPGQPQAIGPSARSRAASTITAVNAEPFAPASSSLRCRAARATRTTAAASRRADAQRRTLSRRSHSSRRRSVPSAPRSRRAADRLR